jgi:hypothetical protein
MVMNKREAVSTKLSLEEIAARAYEAWEKGGCGPGPDMQKWLEAEKQLKASRERPSQTGSATSRQD